MSLTSRTFHIVDGCVLHKKKCKAATSSGLTFGSIFGIFSKKINRSDRKGMADPPFSLTVESELI
jgi:hypothetical protein